MENDAARSFEVISSTSIESIETEKEKLLLVPILPTVQECKPGPSKGRRGKQTFKGIFFNRTPA